MKTKRQLRRELIQSKKQIRELEDKLKDVSNSWKSSDEIVTRQEKLVAPVIPVTVSLCPCSPSISTKSL